MQENHEQQQCFYSDGYMFCNFVVRNGKIIKGRKGWIKFPAPSKKKSKKKITIPME